MKKLFLGLFLLVIAAISLGCDEKNNVIAQEPAPMESEPITSVMGTVTPINNQCSNPLLGFANGDIVTIEIFPGTEGNSPTARVENMTQGTSVDCGGNETLFDEAPISVIACEASNSSIPAWGNGDFISILISYTWEDEIKNNILKSVFLLEEFITEVKDLDTKNTPCVRVKIESMTVTK